jgi:FAD dependent oxidoreductase TIGR03364
MINQHADIAIVGAGIVGLAHAYAAARRGNKVVLFERNDLAVGASIRNFGLIWPIGQPAGPRYERALRSRDIWLDLAARSGLWCVESGSLHLAYNQDELDVIAEYRATTAGAYENSQLLTPAETAHRSSAVRTDGLLGALWSATELNVDPRQALRILPAYLSAEHSVEVRWGTPVTGISFPVVETPLERWTVDRVIVCSGEDFASLYPLEYAASGITRCKLQMLRTVSQPNGWQLGPCLCAGLTLLHYAAFSHCTTLPALRKRINDEMPFFVEHGIHVLLSQTALGELTIGDSHAYGLTHDPFIREEIDQAVLEYLQTFTTLPSTRIMERWVGIYPLVPGASELILHPCAGVTIVNGLGGAGMTLSFGLAEEVVDA